MTDPREKIKEALLPCPCCKNPARSDYGTTNDGEKSFRTKQISCTICGLKTGYHAARHGKAESIWNTRALSAPSPSETVTGEVKEGDIILFNAKAGHPVYGEMQEFIGRVQKDATGLYAANYYQRAWKNMRIIEAPARKENGGE